MAGQPGRPSALVTGASGGIGTAIARRLARDGWDLTLSARRPDGLAETVRRLDPHAGRVTEVCADLTTEDGRATLLARHGEHHDTLDCLVLCAGRGWIGPLDQLPPGRAARTFELNVFAPLRLVQAFLPLLRATATVRAERGARVIALSSLSGKYARGDTSVYGASKAALTSLCESVCAAESCHGVSATAICPGFVATGMSHAVWDRIAPESMIRADDVAEVAVALTRMSRHAVVPEITITRAGMNLYRP
jgi:NAD(P)-dependent dehydrogenase (short-subunit alcohol dehydrogenase family)